ncbi:hypothetical protein E1292_02705 [Nonomuraea deserti]|uniref:Uncharacterized protein n=1 Tax=Nonomuraea deserti TaxID=1848322 RepID=A0A4R4W7I8_9ACTN|nr:hypothetical protein [Nonomuraea deserti]TDD12053.1 hypothetical protein E1292_02705 [Nonomuraea deserti]
MGGITKPVDPISCQAIDAWQARPPDQPFFIGAAPVSRWDRRTTLDNLQRMLAAVPLTDRNGSWASCGRDGRSRRQQR